MSSTTPPTSADSTGASQREASIDLYNVISGGYDATYDRPSHRRAYDMLAWEHVSGLIPPAADIIDVGIGAGRWAERLLSMGHRLTGIEQSPGMIEILQARALPPDFTLLRQSMEDAALPAASADVVMAMGSVQYSADPAAMIKRFASWTKPGGIVCVYVDSLMALVLELLRDGRNDEVLERLATRRGVFSEGDVSATLRLYDKQAIEADFAAAGLVDVRSHGLAVGACAVGRQAFAASMTADEAGVMAVERRLSADPAMADAGLHILTVGRVPERVA